MMRICLLFLFSSMGYFVASQLPCGSDWREVDVTEIELDEGRYYFVCKGDSTLTKELFNGEAVAHNRQNEIVQKLTIEDGQLREKRRYTKNRNGRSMVVKYESFPYSSGHFVDSVHRVIVYDKTGLFKSDQSYCQGKKTGKWKSIGALKQEAGTYVNDQKEGIWYTSFGNIVQYKLYKEGRLVKQNLADRTLKAFYPTETGKNDSIEGMHFYPDGSFEKISYKYHDVVADSIVCAYIKWGSWKFSRVTGVVSLFRTGASWHNDMHLYVALKDRGIRVKESSVAKSSLLLRHGEMHYIPKVVMTVY